MIVIVVTVVVVAVFVNVVAVVVFGEGRPPNGPRYKWGNTKGWV